MTRRIERDTIYRCRRFSAETIELCVRWYATYRLSYRDLAAMMAERSAHRLETTKPQLHQSDAFLLRNLSIGDDLVGISGKRPLLVKLLRQRQRRRIAQ